jgi:hypothetical protein
MKSKFYKPTGFVNGMLLSLINGRNKAVRFVYFFPLLCFSFLSGNAQSAFSFSQLSNDYVRPGAGAEEWLGQFTMSLPGPADVYWRFHWASDFQPGNTAQNSYNWSAFDAQVQAAIRGGQKFSFDIMSLCGACGTDSKPNVAGGGMVYPVWLHNAMQNESVKDWIDGDGMWRPNWNGVYLSAWAALNQAVNNHINNTSYNGVPYKNVIRYIGAGGYGDYGEWTNNKPGQGPNGANATAASLKSIIDGTVQSYPNFQVVCLMATFDGNQLNNTMIPPEVGYYALTTSNNAGKLGYRRESWGDPAGYNDNWSTSNPVSYNGLNFGSAISNIYKYAPVVGEPLDLGVTNNYSDIMRQFQAAHVNSCGNGNFDGVQNNGTAISNFTAAIKASGYRLTLTSGNINGNTVSLSWQNNGLSPTYENWTVTFELRNGNNVIYSQNSSFSPKLFMGTSTLNDVLTGSGTGDLYLIIRDPNGYRQPLPLAIGGRNGDGSYLLKTNVNIGGAAPANKPPVANAGPDQNISLPTNSVTLNGGSSSDPDGTVAGYLWTKISGPAQFALGNSGVSSTLANNLAVGIYLFQLKVTDNSGAIALDTIKVNVNAAPANQPPVANAGADITISLPTSLVNLNGSASNDPDGTISAFSWSQASGPAPCTLMTPGNTATVAGGLQMGVYVFTLKVTDNNGVTATDNMTVTVNAAANIPPVASAGASKSIILPTNNTTLDGSLSSDPNGNITAYGWAQISGPSTATITGGNLAIATAANLVAGQYIFELTVTDNGGAQSKARVKITVSNSGIQPPVANAGVDRSITLPVNTVNIDGSASSSSSGNIVSYVWSEKSGPSTVSLTNAAQISLSNLQAGVYIFLLTVTDNNGATGTDLVTITVIPVVNRAPVADAGASMSLILPVNSTTLDGSKSYDPDGTISSYKWTRISGPNMPATIGATASILNLGGLIAGTYTYQLTVTDDNGASSSSQAKIIVASAANQAPIANAGNNQSISSPANSVTLNGSASSDPDGNIVSYNWITVSGPGSITISNSNSATPTATGLLPGGYIFELTVTDNKGATAKDQVAVTVLPQSISPNQPPVANAGNNQTITLPVSSISLDGSRSFDPDGTLTAYNWKQVSGPSVSVIAGVNSSTTNASQLIAGQYIFQLTVTDNNGLKNIDQITIVVNTASGKVNMPPVADAGSSDTLLLPNNSFTLNANGSKDPDGTISTYQWQQVSGPNTVKSSNMNVPQVAISDFQPGDYEFELIVTDNEGATSTATMKLTVEPSTGLTDRFFVYPNPAHDVTTAKITSSVTGRVKIVIYDMNGRQVLTTEAEKTDDVVTKTLTISTLASGMYTIQIVIGNKTTMVTKFVKN